jgi:serine/threonine protein kinase
MSIETDPRLDTDLAGYRLESVLGRGGMGVVYLAQDLRLKRRVALKLIAPELAADLHFRERFLGEAELAASLDHSHVVPVHAAGETDGQLWMAMRYVQGTDLRTLLVSEGPLAPGRALELISQVAEALDAAHAVGLVHRDVKPANVLVTEEGGGEHCYLADFGLARDRASEAGAPEATHLSGTVDYTAPEQITRQPADQRADLYSLACVLYECLAGEPPFKRPRPAATLYAHLDEQPPSLHESRPQLSGAIDAIINKALAKDPDERYDTCSQFTDAARHALGLGRQPRLTRRRLLLAAGALAAAVAAVAVPLILLGDGEPGPKVALPVTENTLLRIDPRTGEPIAAVPLGEDPGYLAAGEGSVWITDSREQSLLRIDPQRNELISRTDISEAGPVELSGGDERILVGAGAVWLAATDYTSPGSSNTVWRYDPESGSLSEFARAGWFSLVEARADGVWIHENANSELMRLDAASGRTLDTISNTQVVYPTWWAIGDNASWFWTNPDGLSHEGVLVRIDIKTGKTVASVATGLASIEKIEIGNRGVWALGDGDTLIRIDPATNTIDQTIHVGRSNDTMALGQGFIWVGSSRDGTVTRVNPETADLLTIDVGGRPRAITASEGGLWVIVRPT